MKQCHERGSGLRVDMSRPCLLLEAVADTPDCETRIRNFDRIRERNRKQSHNLSPINLEDPSGYHTANHTLESDSCSHSAEPLRV